MHDSHKQQGICLDWILVQYRAVLSFLYDHLNDPNSRLPITLNKFAGCKKCLRLNSDNNDVGSFFS